ncbi:polysaccharide deacetylase family protein [Natronorubrum sp. FCH18a]|uniref:polysaccharide deacetylase family protein n=1 Tax=Natronorubrum sp. FCH18a TaxID=3447018 RepID=UPI003F51140B
MVTLTKQILGSSPVAVMTSLENLRTAARSSPASNAETTVPHDPPSVTNVLSFDLEHWYTATLIRDEVSAPTDRLEESVRIVRELLSAHDVRATFFVVGEVAAEYPEVVRALADDGHEIATHGHTHTPLFDLTPGEFEAELADSADAIADAIGTRPAGFRAPNFSVTSKTRWAFDVLSKSDLRYDSSVFPVRTPMYGVSSAPVRPYYVDIDDPFSTEGRGEAGLLEFPLATFHPTLRMPIAGGFYARLQPTWLLKRGIQNLNRREIPATLYFHPWEFNPAVATTEIPAHKRFVSFRGIETLGRKLEALLSTHEFGTFEQLL